MCGIADKLQHLILVNLVWSGEEKDADYWVQKFEALKPVVHSGKTKTSWGELPYVSLFLQYLLYSFGSKF